MKRHYIEEPPRWTALRSIVKKIISPEFLRRGNAVRYARWHTRGYERAWLRVDEEVDFPTAVVQYGHTLQLGSSA